MSASSPSPHRDRLRAGGGVELAVYTWAAVGEAQGSLTICHGYLEHAGRYQALAAQAAAAGLEVRAFDLRGHGASGGARAAVDALGTYVADLEAVGALAPAGRPRAWLGHSLGGLIALAAARVAGRGPDALVLTNPFLRLAPERRGLATLLAPLVGRLAPGLSLPSGIVSEDLTSDPEEQARHRADPSILPRATAGWAAAIARGQAAVGRGPLRLACPTLLVVGEADRVSDVGASVAAFARLSAPSKDLWRRPGDRHEPLHERGSAALIADVVAWLRARAPT